MDYTIGVIAILAVALFVREGFSVESTDTASKMTINWQMLSHSSLLLLVILVELGVLVSVRREFHAREKSISSLRKIMKKETDALRDSMNTLHAFRVAMGRADYMREIQLAIRAAKNEVVFTSASMEASWRSDLQKEILKAVLDRAGLGKYRHRGVIAMRVSALPGAIELLARAPHLEIRMSPVLCMTRLRFVVADRENVILGVVAGEPWVAQHDLGGARIDSGSIADVPTSSSFVVNSTQLGVALENTFENLFDSGTSPFDYLGEFVRETEKSHDRCSHFGVRQWLGADNSQIADWWLCKSCAAYKRVFFRAIDDIVGSADDRSTERVRAAIKDTNRGRYPEDIDVDWLNELAEEYEDLKNLSPS